MIEELLGILLEGADGGQQQSRRQAQPRSPFEDLLEGVLGGGQQPQQPQAAPSGGIGDLLEGILGGGAPQSREPQQDSAMGGGLGDLLEIFMGGGSGQARGQGAVGSNPLLAPFTEALSEKLGISPQMAAVIVSAAFGLIVGKMSGSRTEQKHSGSSSGHGGNFDLDGLLDGDFLESEGVAEKVAQQTGMDRDEANRSLREAMEMMGIGGPSQSTPKAKPKPKAKAKPKAQAKPKSKSKKSAPKSGSLEGLLDTWD